MYKIETQNDIDFFIEQTNGLHDGYIVSVQFNNNGIKCIEQGCRYEFTPEQTELRIRVLITSILDTEVEMIFKNIFEWRFFYNMTDITETAVSILDDGRIIWTDEFSTDKSVRRDSSYVIAGSMEYCFYNDRRIECGIF